jgi:hypothetical protein
MKIFRAAIFVIGLVSVSTLTQATMVLGPGGASCGTWAGDRQRNEARSQLNQAWVQGFVTAYDVYKPPQELTPKPMDPRSMVAWIDNYCDANPDKDIFDAAKALIEELTGRASQ